MNKLILLFCLSLSLLSCSEKKAATTTVYFSVPGFIKDQARELRSSGISLSRNVSFNGSHEEKIISAPDWDKELKPFAECDLNLAAWKNGFDIDTTYSKKLKTIRYKAREKRIAVRELEVVLEGDSIQSLSIVYLKSNPWYSLGRRLTFTPGIGYTIIIEQDTPLQATESIKLEGRFQ
jgi:hypothetical protein